MARSATSTSRAHASSRWGSRVAAGFVAPDLPPTARRAFRFHMAFALLYSMFEGIIGNVPLMAVKAMNATDAQLQLPLAMASAGIFGSVLFGAAMARNRKKPFVLVPGFAGAVAALVMSLIGNTGWFLFMAGVISICDFAMRPAIPSIIRILYPDRSRSRVSGTMRQYASMVFLVVALISAFLLSATTNVQRMIQIQITVAGVVCAAAFAFFSRLPDQGDGSAREADRFDDTKLDFARATLAPLQNKSFRTYLTAFFVFALGNLFHQGVIPAFLAHDLGLGYVQTTLLIHVIPNVTAFLAGGHMTAWFERTSVWRSYALVTLFWGLDPFIIATGYAFLPALILARSLRGPATLGSMVIAFFTGVHSFSRPGVETSRYMAAQFLITGAARLLAPIAAAYATVYLSRRSIILYGSLTILVSSVMFWWQDKAARWPHFDRGMDSRVNMPDRHSALAGYMGRDVE